jgi:hypothetical protein
MHKCRNPTSREGVDIDQLLRESFEVELLVQQTDESQARVGDSAVVVEHHIRRGALCEDDIEQVPF